MAIKKSQLYSMLWESCNQLRGGMDASLYKNYVLVLLFVKYMSDKQKAGKEMLFTIPEGCTFDDMCRLKNDTHIGEKIDIMLSQWADEFLLTGVLDKASFQDESNLGKGKDLVKTVSKLLNVFQYSGLDFADNRAEDDDLIGDAYEYLMKNFAAESGKSKGQFYTPAEVSRLITRLIGIDKETKGHVTIYDPTCGSGSLLLKAAAAYHPDGGRRVAEIYGQEKDVASVNMAKMNMYIHGVEDHDIQNDDTLNSPQFKDGLSLKQFDYIVANPPFSLKSWRKGALEQDKFGRWGTVKRNRDGEEYIDLPMPPEKCGDYAFLLHIIRSMKDNEGRAAVILPHGVLFRGNAEAEIRKQLVEQHIIEGVVGLPSNLFFGTGIPACVLLLDKRHARARKGIFMINAERLFEKNGAKNRLREQDIKCITDAWLAGEPIDHFARLATFDEIAKNNYNLNISRYITPRDTDVHQCIDAHLHGGIPEADIDALTELWTICPTLRSRLFAPMTSRPGYFQLTCPADEVYSIISEDDSFCRQNERFRQMVQRWFAAIRPELEGLMQGCRPKTLIATWGQRMQDDAAQCACLVDRYTAYDQVLRYWNDTMQDDLFLIADSGWTAKADAPMVQAKKKKKGEEEEQTEDGPVQMKQKDKFTYKELVTDLLPVDIIVREYYADELKAIEEREVARDEVLGLLSSLVDENEEDFDDSFFEKQKFSKANLKKALAVAKREKKAYMQPIIPNWEEWLRLDDLAGKIKREINALTKELTLKVQERYGMLSVEEIKHLVIDEKWGRSIQDMCDKQMQDGLQREVSGIVAMHERYEFTLPELEQTLQEDRDKVKSFLLQMGYTL